MEHMASLNWSRGPEIEAPTGGGGGGGCGVASALLETHIGPPSMRPNFTNTLIYQPLPKTHVTVI